MKILIVSNVGFLGGVRADIYDGFAADGFPDDFVGPDTSNNRAGYEFLGHACSPTRTPAQVNAAVAGWVAAHDPDQLWLASDIHADGGASVANIATAIVTCWVNAQTAKPSLRVISCGVVFTRYDAAAEEKAASINRVLVNQARNRRTAGFDTRHFHVAQDGFGDGDLDGDGIGFTAQGLAKMVAEARRIRRTLAGPPVRWSPLP